MSFRLMPISKGIPILMTLMKDSNPQISLVKLSLPMMKVALNRFSHVPLEFIFFFCNKNFKKHFPLWPSLIHKPSEILGDFRVIKKGTTFPVLKTIRYT